MRILAPSAYRSLLEVMKSAVSVNFILCDGDALWYDVICAKDNMIKEEWTIYFKIPLIDTLGGIFPAVDSKCAYYQRWIREELVRYSKEQEMVAKAKAEWKS